MTLNLTAAHLQALRGPCLVGFAADLGGSAVYLAGPGGAARDGYIVPLNGRAVALAVHDGVTSRITESPLALDAGDRIALYAVYRSATGDFSVTLMVNGALTSMAVDGIPLSSSVTATLALVLKEDV